MQIVVPCAALGLFAGFWLVVFELVPAWPVVIAGALVILALLANRRSMGSAGPRR